MHRLDIETTAVKLYDSICESQSTLFGRVDLVPGDAAIIRNLILIRIATQLHKVFNAGLHQGLTDAEIVEPEGADDE